MDRSVEHVLLRLLTPAFLLFLTAHLAAGLLDFGPVREHPAGRGSSTLYLDAGSSAERATRPTKVQLRTPRTLEPKLTSARPRWLEAAATYFALPQGTGEQRERPAHAVSQVAVPSLFAHARTRNPRDPPLPVT